ncbi:MAG: 50S ribosomal protein L11 methyltransferase [Balneolaceae bacterium]|nr:MAG: 50S ribosomal protein L11 methyltransferase [Balneolaceae bacterium]
MNQPYLELKIVMPEKYQEFLIAELNELDFEGFEQDDYFILAFIPASRLDDTAREHIERIISGFEGAWIESEIIHQPRNWNKEWEGTIQPMDVGNFYIKPTWSMVQVPAGKVVLEIDPKMAFGTGYHETTRLMLRMLEITDCNNAHVLDAGTGSGILAIAALKLGAVSATGFDIDEWSYQNALENAYLNKVDDRFRVMLGTISMIAKEQTFELVLANINRNILLDISRDIAAKIKENGHLLLSGLMLDDRETILKDEHYSRLRLVEEMTEGEWIAFKFQKN